MAECLLKMKLFQKIIFGLSIIIFIGLCYISSFNVFQTDDYIYASQTRDLGALENAFTLYKNWGGRYLTYSLNTIIPAGKSEFYWLPKVLPIVYFTLLIFGFYNNLRFYFKQKKTEALEKSFILFLFYTICLSSISEHYFWISGANVYFLSFILANFLIYFFGKFQHNKKVKPIIFLLIILLMGSNEFIAIYLLLFLIFNFFLNKHKNNLIFLGIGIFGFLLSFLAPGNFNRMTESDANFWFTNVKRIGVFIINSGYVFLKIILILPLFIKIFEIEIKTILSKISINRLKIYLAFSVVTLLFSGFLILLNSSRTLEIITFYTLLLSSLLVYHYFENFKKIFWISALILLLPTINLFELKSTKFRLSYNINAIFQEVMYSKLAQYEEQVNARHRFLRKSKEPKIYLQPITSIPKILYFQELGIEDKTNYINSQLEKFYKKEHIFLQSQ